MVRRPLIISESEKKNILSLYKILNEVDNNFKVKITGTITDENDVTVIGAKIVITDKSSVKKGSAVTDENGKFIIDTELKSGTYDVTIIYPDYKNYSQVLEVTKDLEIEINKKLELSLAERPETTIKRKGIPGILMNLLITDQNSNPLSDAKIYLSDSEGAIFFKILETEDKKIVSEKSKNTTTNGELKNIFIETKNYPNLNFDFNNCQTKKEIQVKVLYQGETYDKNWVDVCTNNIKIYDITDDDGKEFKQITFLGDNTKKIKITIISNKIEVNLIDNNLNAVKNASITITLPDGTTLNTKTDENGKYIIPNKQEYIDKNLLITINEKNYENKKVNHTIKKGNNNVSINVVKKIKKRKIDFLKIPFYELLEKSRKENKPAFVVFTSVNDEISEDLFDRINTIQDIVDKANNDYIPVNYINDENDVEGNITALDSLKIDRLPAVVILQATKKPNDFNIKKRKQNFSSYFNNFTEYIDTIVNLLN
jgi:hypothetical protein